MIGRKTVWTKKQIKFLRDNFGKMNNRELASAVGQTLTITRMKLYEMGLKRMELEYWTKEQIRFLKKNYKKMGDVEIAEYFNAHFHKDKGWTKKHIEKKRRYLKLKRSTKVQDNIKKRNTKQGRFSLNHYKRWLGRSAAIGTIKVWNLNGQQIPVIKVKENCKLDNFMKLSHYIWTQANGPIPKGHMITHKDKDTMNCALSNLLCITKAENAKRNSKDRYNSVNWIASTLAYGDRGLREEIKQHPELIELKRMSLILQRSIKNAITKNPA